MRTNRLNIGILAHVDAGKTTLAEAMLYLTGSIRRAGRVDHGDAFLDHFQMERERGITIFSKQAQLKIGPFDVTLLDTPGHEDFSAEMERALQILDYAVLVISAADGAGGHVRTLWRLLERYHIPTFVFVNKMDQPLADKDAVSAALAGSLSGSLVDFTEYDARTGAFCEETAVCDEALLESYLESGTIEDEQIAGLVRRRRLFPCFYGSALKMTGVEEFLSGLARLLRTPDYPEDFGARVYKISRDAQGTRLTWLKITGGELAARQTVTGTAASRTGGDEEESEQETWTEKVDQIRIYDGKNFVPVQTAEAGCVCAVTGLTRTFCGQGLGALSGDTRPVLEPVLSYRMSFAGGEDVHRLLPSLRALEEEIPELNLDWDTETKDLQAQVMGEVQIQILQRLIHDRFGVEAVFGDPKVVYRETIAEPAEGAGHFEPLRHYAEVRLRLEPAPRGSGLTFASAVSTDVLARNWQRLILSALQSRQHRGVLTGSPVTDMKITLTGGRAHLKHTEGGDFAQAARRAVRQGLRRAESILLEPVYEYRLEVPAASVGRAMTDVRNMGGTVQGPETEGSLAVLTGTAPVAKMRNYQKEVTAYTKGEGHLLCLPGGYAPCQDAQSVIEASGYDPDADVRNPCGSVFCAHGAGYYVPWDEVEAHMHTEEDGRLAASDPGTAQPREQTGGAGGGYAASLAGEKELEEIFVRTYGRQERRREGWERSPRTRTFGETAASSGSRREEPPVEEFLLVDGYNIIFSWDELRELAAIDLSAARERLSEILSNYRGYRRMTLILVFDAYRVEGGQEHIAQKSGIYVVYTAEAETADSYIEKTVHRIGRKADVTVATSDRTEQMIIWGSGARRLSAGQLLKEIEDTCEEIRREYLKENPGGKVYLFDQADGELARILQALRLGRTGDLD